MRTLSNSQIARILDTHNTSHYTENNRIFAISGCTTRAGRSFWTAEDLTGSTKADLLAWLGY